jgi:hypothetical protein
MDFAASLEWLSVFRQNRGCMATPFSPTRQGVEQYRRFRALSVDLGERLIKTIPRQAYNEVGDAISILHNGVLVLDSMDMTSVVADCCLYDWFQDGKNLVQRYAETHPAQPGTDESCVLNACLRAKYRVLVTQSIVRDAGIYCRDVLNGGELFLMDVAFIRTLQPGRAALATRTIPLGEYWMTGGAALPINSATGIREALSRIETGRQELPEGPGAVSLTIVRACLAAGAAEYIAYESPEARAAKARRQPGWPGFKRRRH